MDAIKPCLWKKYVHKVLKEACLYLQLDGIDVPPEYELDFFNLASASELTTSDFPKPSTSVVEPNTSAVEPSTSALELSSSAVAPSTSAVEPSKSTVEPSTSADEPSTSAVEPSTSTVEPSTSDVDNALIDFDPYSDNKSQKEMSKIKKQDKAELKKLIIKQCTEDLISPPKLEKLHNIGKDTIIRWVKRSGAKLPTKYNEHSMKLHTKKPLGPNEQTASLTNELISNLKSKWPSLTGTETNVDLQNSP